MIEDTQNSFAPEFLEDRKFARAAEKRYLQTNNLDALNEAAKAYHYVLSHPNFVHTPEQIRLAIYNDAGIIFLRRYWHLDAILDLEFALQLFQQAVTNAPDNSPDLPMHLTNLGVALGDLYARTKLLETLEQMVKVSKQAITLTPTNSPDYLPLLNNLGTALRDIYKSSKRLEDLNEAILVFKQVVALTPVDSPNRPLYLNNLGLDLRKRYIRMKQFEDIKTAIDALELAVMLTPVDSPLRLSYLTNWGNGLSELYEHTGQLVDLEKAISVYQQVVEFSPISKRPSYLSNLGTALSNRYARTGRLEDLEEAIRVSRQAVELAPTNSPDYPTLLTNLGAALGDHYDRTNRLEDLKEVINVFELAVELSPMDLTSRPTCLYNLGIGLRDIYRFTKRLEVLEEAIRTLKLALESTPTDSHFASICFTSLGNCMSDAVLAGQVMYVDEAIWFQKQAVALTTTDSPIQSVHLTNLAESLANRYVYMRKLEDLDESRRLFRQACELAKHHSQHVALFNSHGWGKFAFERQAWDEASQAYLSGVQAIWNLNKVQFSRVGKELWMRDARGLPALAAYSLAKYGDYSTALDTLESGRARLLGEALERTRHDLELLANTEFGHKDLLERYRDVSARYVHITKLTSGNKTFVKSQKLIPENWMQQLESIQSEIDGVINEIRQVPGYETFFLSPSVDQIQQQAKDAPLVYFAVTSAGGLVLIATENAIHVVELPDLTEDTLQKQVADTEGQNSYLTTYRAWLADPHDELKSENWKQALDQTASWLWDIVMQPVVEKLETIISSGSHVVLIPCGWLSLLPLHAAWTLDETRPGGRLYALDEYTFTYAPSAQALMRARHQAETMPSKSLLMVENPDRSLGLSEPAAQAALAVFDASTHLLEGSATFEAVTTAFNEHNVLYFFTHGIANFDEPLNSALALADEQHPLTLADIFNLKTDHARLAILSACETGLPSNLDLLDEVVSLPSGLMQAGVPGVIGSLWTVSESSTAMLMTIFFEQWKRAGLSAPEALRQAQRMMRDTKRMERYFKDALPENRDPGSEKDLLPADVADVFHKELMLLDDDLSHPFYWAAFTYIGL